MKFGPIAWAMFRAMVAEKVVMARMVTPRASCAGARTSSLTASFSVCAPSA
jgi:hypothetical protein